MATQPKYSPSAFLSLPLDLRESIYASAGLVRDCPINVNEESHRWMNLRVAYKTHCGYYQRNTEISSISEQTIHHWQSVPTPYYYPSRCVYNIKRLSLLPTAQGMGCIHPHLPVHLMLVSKQVQAEVLALLYAKNTFVAGPYLSNLTWFRLDILKSLEIQLTTCSCRKDHLCPALDDYVHHNRCKLCHFGCKRGTGDPLAAGDSDSRSLLRSWKAFCVDLQQRNTTQLKYLVLICDCNDIETALEVVGPLQHLPILDYASIRLSQSLQRELNKLAEQTVHHLTRRKTSTFPFTRLPAEIQQQILGYTDLVASDYLIWSQPVEKDDLGNGETHRNYIYSGFRLLSNKQVVCCLQCTLSYDVCACPWRHAAYSSRVCKCWKFPAALFFVNKLFNKLAGEIFFGQNRFALWEYSNVSAYGLYTASPKRLETPLRFFQHMPEKWSRQLRWIKICGRSHDYEEGLPTSDMYASWTLLARSMQQRLCLARLTFELDLTGDIEYSYGPAVPDAAEPDFSQSLWSLAKLFKPAGKHCYKDFFIRATHDVGSIEEDWARWRLERDLEKYIMGPEYDATARGKYHDKTLYDESIQPKMYWRLSEGMSTIDERLFIP